MSLAPGVRLGACEVHSLLGIGGMGEVYRARDTTLNRDVALKILPEAFARDPDRLSRFKRKAHVLAALNHPNIAAIYGLEESCEVHAPILELVEGETLADRIARGPIPLDEALPIARQIAEALEAAHEQGVIHRDLKPANIKLRPDGTVKVLDFGLAKLAGPAEAGPNVHDMGADATHSPTITNPAMTGMGVILGTAAYMAPEQAKGRAADRRSDVWAFGCVLYEMLSGKRAFDGEDTTDVLGAVVRLEPDWTALPTTTPAPIRRLLRRCLDKNPRERLHDISDARLDLKDATTPSGEATTEAAAHQRRRFGGIAMLVFGVVAGGTLAAAVVWLTARPSSPHVARLTVSTTGAAALVMDGFTRDLTISPDGTRLVYSNGKQLFVRALDQLETMALSDLGVPRHPFISPDSEWIGYFDGFNSQNGLKKVSIRGGPAITVCACTNSGARGATWGPDDTIIFATAEPSGLLRVSAAGGEPMVLTTPDIARGERDHFWPELIPGRQAVLFTILPTGDISNAQVVVLDLQTGAQKVVVRGGSHAHYVPTGHLVYASAGALQAVAFDLDSLEPIGNPVPVIPDVLTAANGAADFDIARDGTLVYVGGGLQTIVRTLAWVDREGREEPLEAPARGYTYPRLSPDGQRLAVDVRDRENDIWIWDLVRRTLTRFTFDGGLNSHQTWTPDGQRLIFISDVGGPFSLYWQASDGTGTVERLGESPNPQRSYAVTPDGTQLIIREDMPKTGMDVMVMALDRERVERLVSQSAGDSSRSPREVQPLVQTRFNELNADLSPDGRWLAYQSDESGQNEIFVRPFPNTASGRWQISTASGVQPLWARNGQELFYLTATGTMMSARVEANPTFAARPPTKLFDGEGRFYLGGGSNQWRTYDVSLDGRRFLMIKTGSGTDTTIAAAGITVVINWTEELRRLVPTTR